MAHQADFNMDPYLPSGGASAMPKIGQRKIKLYVYSPDGMTLQNEFEVFAASLARQDAQGRRFSVDSVQDVDLKAFEVFIRPRVERYDPTTDKLTWNSVSGQLAIRDQLDWETALTEQLNSLTSQSNKFIFLLRGMLRALIFASY